VSQVEAYTRLAGVYDEIVVDPCHGAWASFLQDLWRSDEPGVRDVLDVCCGTGLLAAELAALGYRVVGVDASADMLARARTLFGPDVPLLQSTLPELAVDGDFDAAVCTYDGLNYLDPADLRATFAALADRLRPAGWLVFDVHTDAMMTFIASQPLVRGEQDDHRYAIESRVDGAARTCDTRIEVEGADGFAERHRQWFHRASDIRGALVATGFGTIEVRDDYSDRPADASTLSATWIARRRADRVPA
jgi:SAM-dependent methyltransferase